MQFFAQKFNTSQSSTSVTSISTNGSLWQCVYSQAAQSITISTLRCCFSLVSDALLQFLHRYKREIIRRPWRQVSSSCVHLQRSVVKWIHQDLQFTVFGNPEKFLGFMIQSYSHDSMVVDQLYWDCDCSTLSGTNILWVKSIIVMNDRVADSSTKKLKCFNNKKMFYLT